MLRVVATLLYDAGGRVLVNERPAGKPMAGYWEFPGGKLAVGETESECVVRELREELGIEVRGQHALLSLLHHYPERTVLLGVHVIDAYDGIPTGVEGQRLAWLAPSELESLPLLPADLPIVATLRRVDRGTAKMHGV